MKIRNSLVSNSSSSSYIILLPKNGIQFNPKNETEVELSDAIEKLIHDKVLSEWDASSLGENIYENVVDYIKSYVILRIACQSEDGAIYIVDRDIVLKMIKGE